MSGFIGQTMMARRQAGSPRTAMASLKMSAAMRWKKWMTAALPVRPTGHQRIVSRCINQAAGVALACLTASGLDNIGNAAYLAERSQTGRG
ncbi:MAG: hypothetical protein VBE63_19415 [Lamprobacter sp.]|uniref:hypothetical protein n=1 Tax=Lamprobacter sp. TaxID=3100796 RepID=UPI002B258953|nr:hypothetical protein [Lamprobacter sp.]MEA3642087.1 hypothetical protein [Lamprobacter sp.]